MKSSLLRRGLLLSTLSIGLIGLASPALANPADDYASADAFGKLAYCGATHRWVGDQLLLLTKRGAGALSAANANEAVRMRDFYMTQMLLSEAYLQHASRGSTPAKAKDAIDANVSRFSMPRDFKDLVSLAEGQCFTDFRAMVSAGTIARADVDALSAKIDRASFDRFVAAYEEGADIQTRRWRKEADEATEKYRQAHPR